MKPNIGLTLKNQESSLKMLTQLLADEMTLYVKTRKSHWDVSGDNFMELHKLFEQQYKITESAIDEVAERIGKIGYKTIGTMSEFLSLTALKEHPSKYPKSKEMIKELLEDHEIIIMFIRKSIEKNEDKNKDAGTIDFITGLMEEHETTAWTLRRYLD